jgi:hypothetical protein
MAKADDPFGFSEAAKMALEQTHQAMDTYFDFLKKSNLGISVRRNRDWGQVEGTKPVEPYCVPGTR